MSPDQGHGGPPPNTSDPTDPGATVLRPRPAPPPQPPADEDVGATIAFPTQAESDVGATIAFPTQADADVGATIAFTQQPPPPATAADPGATVAFTAPPPLAGAPATGVAAGAAATGTVQAPPPNPALANRPAAAPAWPVAPKRKRSKLPWVLTFFLLAAAGAVAAYLLLHKSDTTPPPAVVVTKVVVASQPTAGCNSQVTVTGTITTNGQAGSITYQWSRSDGQKIDPQQLDATASQTTYQVPLLWSVAGKGRFDAVATLTVSNPTGVAPASGHFVYAC